MPRKSRRLRSGGGRSSTWHEVDLLRSSINPFTGSLPHMPGYRTRLASLRNLSDPRVGAHRLGPGARRALKWLGLLMLAGMVLFAWYAVTVSGPGDVLELAAILLYLLAVAVLIPLSFVLVVRLVRLPFRAIGALRRR
jgi:hypothetical protein